MDTLDANPTTPTKQNTVNYKLDETQSNDESNASNFLECTSTDINPIGSPSMAGGLTVEPAQNVNSSTFMNMEHTEALQHLEKALSACEATLTETPGMVKMEPDEQFTQQDKPYSISMVPSNNCSPGSPFPPIEGEIIYISLCFFFCRFTEKFSRFIWIKLEVFYSYF